MDILSFMLLFNMVLIYKELCSTIQAWEKHGWWKIGDDFK